MSNEEHSPPSSREEAAGYVARFRDKIAVVTGPSDRGIGGAVAERLAREGAVVCLAGDQEPTRLLRRLERIGAEFLWAGCDVTQPADIKAAIAGFVEACGRLDVIVNNAGIEKACRFEEVTPEQWQQHLDVNLTGAMRLTQTALPHLSAPGGVVVNVASALGIAGCASFTAYSASKAGLIGWTQSLAMELAPRGMRAVCVAPAMVHTPMIHKHIAHLTKEVADQIMACHPLGMGTTHDVAAAVAFLASSEARWITGVTLPLGFTTSYPLPVHQFLQAE